MFLHLPNGNGGWQLLYSTDPDEKRTRCTTAFIVVVCLVFVLLVICMVKGSL